VVLALLGLAGPAAAQDTGQGSVLIVLDASKSMNEPAGNGGTRLDAAKAALEGLIPALPRGAQVGLRVYGSQVSEASRAAGCRDTRLVLPVGPLDAGTLRSRVQGLQGKGRTPIGRSLLAAAADLPRGGRRVVVLVSDGGDNCAPPAPCRAAAQVAKQGVNLSISVVGLQVDARVRRQLRCIADAGGGSYVDAGDAGALRSELLAALARAFRSYDPQGTAVTGGGSPAQAPLVGEGAYLDSLRPGDTKSYAVRVGAAQRLFASLVLPLPRGLDGDSATTVRLLDPAGKVVAEDSNAVRFDPLGQYGNIEARGIRGPQAAVAGVWRVQTQLEAGSLTPRAIPLELGVQVLDPEEAPGLVRVDGPPPGPPPAPGARPRRAPTAAAAPKTDSGGSSAGLIAGGGGLLAGLLGGFGFARRRR
jgi:Ca-activated chloride channel family protein